MSESKILPELHEWIAQLDELSLTARLKHLESELERIDVEIQEREAHRAALKETIETGYIAIRLKARWTQDAQQTIESTFGTPHTAVNGTPARGREAIRALLREMPEVDRWTIQTVLRQLVKRGWADEDDEHSVGVSLSRMFRAGELYRPAHGVYTTRRELMEGGE